MIRYLSSYCPDFNPKEGSYHQAKDFIRGMTLPPVASFSATCLTCMFLRKFYEETAKVHVFQKLWL